MGDALSDLTRDTSRQESYELFLERIKEYLEKPSEKKYNAIGEAADQTDKIRGGYWTGKSNLSELLSGGLIKKLQQGDESEWAKLLTHSPPKLQEGLKQLSPFKEMTLVKIQYGNGFVRNLEIQGVHEHIERNGGESYDCSTYLIPLSKESLGKPIKIK